MSKRKPVARMTVERDGATVRLAFSCADEYQAIELYAELLAQSADGQIVALDVGPNDPRSSRVATGRR